MSDLRHATVHLTDSLTKRRDIIQIKAFGNRPKMAFQRRSRAVHAPRGIPIGPAQHPSKHPGLPAPISAAGNSFPMLEDREPFPPRPIGDPIRKRPPVPFSFLGGLPQGVEQPGDPSRPRRPRGSGSSAESKVVEQW